MTSIRKKMTVNFFILSLTVSACIVLLPAASIGQNFNVITDEIADMASIDVGDLDLDGEVDLVYSEWSAGGRIAYGEGGGFYETPVAFPAAPVSIIKIDYVDADTLLDIIAISQTTVNILINNGDRTFTHITWEKTSTDVSPISTGYFNDDAYLDFITSPALIYFGNGSGSFPTSDSLPVGQLVGADVGDFNKDGYDDIIALDGTGITTARILLNDSTGIFSKADSMELGNLSLSVSTNNALADFNNDGNPDFALITPLIGVACSAGFHTTVATVAYGDGNGGISGTDTITICGTSYPMAIADVDGDLELDIVAMNGSFKRLEVAYGNGDGTFEEPVRVPLGVVSIPFVIATDDLDHDGNPDFITNGSLIGIDNIYSAINEAPDKAILEDPMVTTGFNTVDFAITNPYGHRISRLKNSVAGARFDRLDKDSNGNLDVQTMDRNLQYGDYTIVLKRKPNITELSAFNADIRIGDEVLHIFKDHETPGTSKSGSPDDSLVFHLTVAPSSSVSPASGRTTYDNTPNFNWTPLMSNKNSADTYDFQLDTQFDFSSPIVDATGLSTKSYLVTTPLERDKIFYWRVRSFDGFTYSEWSHEFAVYVGPFYCGDVNNDGNGPNIVDLVHIVNYMFRNGPIPAIPANADLNGDGMIANALDLTVLVNYFHRNGPLPSCGL